MKNFANKKMIVTADDYGMCGIVNEAIDRCISVGLVTSTNVIVNMDDLERARTLRERFPNVSVGLHWNVTAGKPLLDKELIPSLVDEDGIFHPVSTFLKLFHSNRIKKHELILELTEQYQRFKELCGQPDYWNTHQNSAFDFRTFTAFNQLALQFRVNKTRSFRRVYVKERGIFGIRNLVVEMLKKLTVDFWFGYLVPRTGTHLPEGRIYFFVKNQILDQFHITNQVSWNNKELVELVIHPAISGEYKYFGTLSHARVCEYQMFSSRQTLDLLTSQGIQLVNFDAVR